MASKESAGVFIALKEPIYLNQNEHLRTLWSRLLWNPYGTPERFLVMSTLAKCLKYMVAEERFELPTRGL